MELRGTLLFLQNKQKNLYLAHVICFNVGTGSVKSAARLIEDGRDVGFLVSHGK